MRKILLIAAVSAIAITAPAQAERGKRAEQAEQEPQQQQARADRRAARQQQASEQRATRQQEFSQRRERPQEQVSERRAARQQQMVERRARTEQQFSERRAAREQQMLERRSQQQAISERRAARQQQMVERRARIQEQEARSERRAVRQQQAIERRARTQQATTERRARIEQQQFDRRSLRQQQAERRSQVRQDRIDRRQELTSRRATLREGSIEPRLATQQLSTQSIATLRQQAWQQRADRLRVLGERRERLRDSIRARFGDDDRNEFRTQRLFSVGQTVNPNWWYDDYVPVRYSTRYFDTDDYYYRYDGDYLYRLRRDDNIVMALFPLLGGAYSVGRPLPFYYDSYYNVPWGYSSLYYDTPDYYYRYGDNAIYQVDPTTQLIAGIVALLTGQSFGIGQMLPLGYDVYNVPYGYRSSYYDTVDMWYRYDDGYIYGVDPRSRLIVSSYPVYSGYSVGNPWPSYAGYDYGVPGYYDDLYYDDPRYDYRYASGGIYAVDPTTQLVAALVALVTGQNFAVGQRLPLGYDVYNVPFAYRDDYYDDDDDWYRYADGRIYQVDPQTRLIERVIYV